MAQSRSKKKADVLAKKRALGSADSPPILTAILSFQNQDEEAGAKLVQTLKTCSPDIRITENEHIAFPR